MRRPVLRRLDWSLLVAVAALVLLGGLLVWSSTAERPDVTSADSTRYLVRHIASVLAGLALGLPVVLIGYRRLVMLVPFGYLAVLAGLAAVLAVGTTVNGARSWITLAGGLSIQPAEFAKLAVIGGMAVVLAEKRAAGKAMRGRVRGDASWALVVAALPIVSVLAQPDVGTALVLAAIALAVLALSGVRLRWMLVAVTAGVAAALGFVASGVLADYQVDRLTAFLHPEADPQGVGYNVLQARTAIAAGGLTGQGLFHGSRTGGDFVPEQHTDFLFTVAAEELGFAGASAILVLLGFVLWRGSRIAGAAPDLFGQLVAGGIICWLGVQTFENVGMAVGLAPVTGVPLPFMSYGGSSMAACLLAVAVLQNIHLHASGPDSATGQAV